MDTKIPVTVGIIGHLDAIITTRHKALVSELFNDLSKRCPNSPVVLFSQLARGADLEIAKLFIQIKEQTNRDYSLIVPLPFNKEKYILDFNEEDKEQFNTLISKSSRSFVIKNTTSEPSEKKLYKASGEFVADSSIILIAIWEEMNNGKVGGTADIVNYKKYGISASDKMFDEAGKLISLACNRRSSSQENILNLPDVSLFSVITEDAGIKKSLEKIEELNTAFSTISAEALLNSQNNLYSDNTVISGSNILLKKYYSITDTLAIENQKKYNRFINIFFILGFGFISCFEIYKHTTITEIFIGWSLGLIVIAFLVYQFSKKQNSHSKFLEFRILAEVLRIQFFWNLCNLNGFVTNHILRIHKLEFFWLKHIIHAVNGITYGVEENNVSPKTIKECWINSEKHYFIKKIAVTDRIRKTLNTVSSAFFLTALICMVALFLTIKIDFNMGEKWAQWTTVAAGLSLGIFALSKAYLEIKGIQETINQYALMKEIYTSAANKIEDIEFVFKDSQQKKSQLERVYFSAGREALIENGNWYLIFKQKEPKVKIG